MKIDWSGPDCDQVWAERTARLDRLGRAPEALGALKEYYKDNPVAFINDWGCTIDPRNAELGLPVTIPFILFPKQEEFVKWLVARWRARENGLAEKSRDMGVSWICCAVAVWMWLFYDGAVIGFGSRKEEYVDRLGDPKCLFWKVRKFITLLPKELRPHGWEERQHGLYMRILNPSNGSAIVGEAGDNIGRGNRTSIYFLDESAFYDRPDSIDAAVSQTSNCKIDVSTPNGNGNAFFRKRHSGKVPVFTLHWRDDPRKSQEWYDKQVKALDPVIVAQEIDIDYNASTNNAWIDGALLLDAQKNGPADIEATGQWIIGVDAAHMGNDESVIHMRKGRLNLEQRIDRKLEGPALAGRIVEEIRALEFTGEYVRAIVVELDGPGVSCHDHLKLGYYGARVIGVHTGARLRDNINYNVRALLWRRARDYLNSPPVALHNDTELRAQLSSMRYAYKDGLLLMQDKKTYKKDYGRSPDRADAFVLTFADTDVIQEEDYEEFDYEFLEERSAYSGY